MSDERRFWDKVDVRGAEECWPWLAGKDQDGYGVFWLGGTTTRAHRVAYEWCVGPIPPGKQLDHVRERGCTQRACVNPAHLEPVTCLENLARSDETWATVNRRKTACPQGHPYSTENTLERAGRRICRTCKRSGDRERKSAERARKVLARASA